MSVHRPAGILDTVSLAVECNYTKNNHYIFTSESRQKSVSAPMSRNSLFFALFCVKIGTYVLWDVIFGLDSIFLDFTHFWIFFDISTSIRHFPTMIVFENNITRKVIRSPKKSVAWHRTNSNHAQLAVEKWRKLPS